LIINAWALAALWFDLPFTMTWRLIFVFLTLTCHITVFITIRSLLKGCLAHLILFLGVLIWWLCIPASNTRDWSPEYKRLPQVTRNGQMVQISNVRHFQFFKKRAPIERWETRIYDLDTLTGVDMFFSHWGSDHIAHTILSWQFKDNPPLAISIETRRERGESYRAILGFFRQFELYYVIGDEHDLIKSRTNVREEDVYLYRLQTPITTAKEMLLDYFTVINQLAKEPKWYNAATQNCTTTIRQHAKQIAINSPFSWQILLNGHLPELGYQQGTINNTMPYEQMRSASYITDKGKRTGDHDDYSKRIRVDLPERPIGKYDKTAPQN